MSFKWIFGLKDQKFTQRCLKQKQKKKEIKKQLWSCHKWGVAFIYFFVIESEAGKGSSLKYVISNLKFTEF